MADTDQARGASPSNLVLVVDDDPLGRAVVVQLLRAEGCTVEDAADGRSGYDKAVRLHPDLILLDVVMPGLDGFQVCEKIRQKPGIADVPILMVTSLEDRPSRIRGIESGADDFLSKPIDPTELRARVRTILRLNRYRRMAKLNAELQIAYEATLEGLVRALDLRDHETEGHTQRVTTMTMTLAEAIGVPHDQLIHVRRGALLHDLGKIGIPDAVLLKPGRLTPEERTIIEQHPTFAYKVLESIEFLKPAIEIPWCHHERWDGKGYPQGLAGTQIPLAARVFAVVDVWDAVTSKRPYHDGMTRDEARAILRKAAGSHFDPMVVDLFLELEAGGIIDAGLHSFGLIEAGVSR
jgi:putative two-component system response regulator